MAEICCVSGCITTLRGPKGLKLYRVPTNGELSVKWRKKIGTRRVDINSRVCSDHFTEKDYMISNLGWKILVPDAIPSQNLPDLKRIVRKAEIASNSKGPLSSAHDNFSASSAAEAPLKCNLKLKNLSPHLDSSKKRRAIPFHDYNQSALKINLYKHILNYKEHVTNSTAQFSSLCEELQLKSYKTVMGKSPVKSFEEWCKDARGSKEMLLQFQGKEAGEPVLYTCEECGREFLCPDAFSYHFKSHGKSRLFSCRICNARFSSHSAMVDHFKVHKKWPCQICETFFDSKSDLHIHTAKIHPDKKPFICSYCGDRFSVFSVLKEHVNCHIGEEISYCKFCGIQINDPTTFVTHFMSHLEEQKATSLTCMFCSRKFSSLEVLEAHVALHSSFSTSDIAMPMEDLNETVVDSKIELLCHLCGLVCTSNSSYLMHMEAHMNTLSESVSNNNFNSKLEGMEYSDSVLGKHLEPIEQIVVKVENFNDGEDLIFNHYLDTSNRKAEVEQSNEPVNQGIPLTSKNSEATNSQKEVSTSINNSFHENCDNSSNAYDMEPGCEEFSCIECGKLCGSSTQLTLHYEKHVKEEPTSWSSDES